ncbi:hypothetical protein K469DRAFT_720973, partial [Zopfia rhizophila CBS 207.26]
PSATAPEPINPQASGSCHAPNNGHPWPSQIAQTSSTMWLLPPYSGQSSAIALLLQKEIQSHNITREMLHATEQRRMEAIQYCNRSLADNRVWSAAYNNLTAALHRCSQEYSRLSAENEAMRAQIHDLNSQVIPSGHPLHLMLILPQTLCAPSFELDPTAPQKKQIQVLQKRLSRQLNEREVSSDGSWERKLCVAGNELECSPSPYSPDA